MATLPTGALQPAGFLAPFFLIAIVLQIYRLYRVRVYHEPIYFWNIRKIKDIKIKNMDNFINTYTYFSICSIIVFIVSIIIVQFVRLEYINIYLSIVVFLSVPIGITFYFKLKNS